MKSYNDNSKKFKSKNFFHKKNSIKKTNHSFFLQADEKFQLRSLNKNKESLSNLLELNVLLFQINQIAYKIKDENSFLKTICELIFMHTDIKLVFIGTTNKNEEIEFKSISGIPGILNGINISVRSDIPEGQGMVGKAFREKKPVYLNFLRDPVPKIWYEKSKKYNLSSGAAFPIFRNNNIWGIISFYHSEENFFEDALVRETLERISYAIGMGLEHIDIVNKEIKLAQLRNALLNNAGVGIVMLKYPQREIISSNKTFAVMLGFEDEREIIGLKIREFYPDDETYEKVGQFTKETVFQNKSAVLRNVCFLKKNKTILYSDISGTLIEAQDNVKYVIWTVIDVTERGKLSEELKYQESYDPLTGLPNRIMLERELENAFLRAKRFGWPMALAIINIDRFRTINEKFGYLAGNEVLKVVASRLKTSLRKTDFICRFSIVGDEFAIIFENCQDRDKLSVIFKKIEKNILDPIHLKDSSVVNIIGLSMGVSLFPYVKVESQNEMIRNALQALYDSKKHKQDRSNFWTIYGDEITKKQNHYQMLLEKDRVVVYYQPIYDNQTSSIVGVEALARLLDDSGDILYPEKFLSKFTNDNLLELTRQVLTIALRDLEELKDDGFSLIVSVNVEPGFVSEKFVEIAKNIIQKSKLEPSKIFFEILERTEFAQIEKAIEYLAELKKIGVRLALDDVGSAYSSLLRIKNLSIDKIKLDQSFIRGLEKNPQDLHFVESIFGLARAKGIYFVVEGVETPDIFDALISMGVPLLQGYAIAKPMPKDLLRDFLISGSYRFRSLKSLLGIYSKQLVQHGILERSIYFGFHIEDILSFKDFKNSQLYIDMKNMGIPEDSLVFKYYEEYYNAVNVMNKNPIEDNWNKIREIENNLERAIIKEYRKRKRELKENF
ncbi:PAS domain S-box-containing protein/diguanylate cyclase (GGDEF) domain-containing protein [Thermodesulfobium acidiphilum]|uniref:PAS domain S-box-containing protein/diguanylate cyclase (GGDEF) domain-containing protein n=1 Tax=Thermodesulfobium acidiphilum TaxID=1794699 RepID=A0A2R4W0Q7_THEAF|nr:EAL domain-containing protein [Thermodesulfobium acidiphilum]AWB10332.1 PAS domain S-box-containing protein/diguanylate cyclase (GGDEF) domain-containing protein [Thermodesulfobium acidiphilum]